MKQTPSIVIYHNPRCSKSRKVVELVQEAGLEAEIVECLKTGWTRPQLLTLFAVAGLAPRDALRESESQTKELGLLEQDVSDDKIVNAMIEHPVLVNRPIVATAKGIKICRPPELVHELLK